MQIKIAGPSERPFKVAGLSSRRDDNRGTSAARIEHGSGGVHSDRGPEEVYERKREY